MKRCYSSDSDSVALITPLTTPIFDFHWVISPLSTPLKNSTPTSGNQPLAGVLSVPTFVECVLMKCLPSHGHASAF